MWEFHKEGWVPKNWCSGINWCWRRLLRVLWTARRSNQLILKEINPEYSLEGLMLKLQYFGHLIQRADSLEKILMLRKTEGQRRRGCQRMRWLDNITESMDMNWLQETVKETVKDKEAWCAVVHGVTELDTVYWLNTSDLLKSEALERGPSYLCFNKLSMWLWYMLNLTTPELR